MGSRRHGETHILGLVECRRPEDTRGSGEARSGYGPAPRRTWRWTGRQPEEVAELVLNLAGYESSFDTAAEFVMPAVRPPAWSLIRCWKGEAGLAA